MITKEEVLKRVLKFNSPTGRTVKAVEKVFSTTYPAGTNLVVEFVKEFKNLPYGDDGKRLDKKADCSQFWINVLYYWFGVDHLGSYTESIFHAKGAKTYKSFYDAPVLSVILWKLSNRNRNATHAAGKMSASTFGDTRGKTVPFNPSRKWPWNESKVTRLVDFITEEQRKNVTVQAGGGGGTPKPEPILERYKYAGSSYIWLRSKPSVITGKRLEKIWRGQIITKVAESGDSWWAVKMGVIGGYCTSKYKFEKVK